MRAFWSAWTSCDSVLMWNAASIDIHGAAFRPSRAATFATGRLISWLEREAAIARLRPSQGRNYLIVEIQKMPPEQPAAHSPGTRAIALLKQSAAMAATFRPEVGETSRVVFARNLAGAQSCSSANLAAWRGVWRPPAIFSAGDMDGAGRESAASALPEEAAASTESSRAVPRAAGAVDGPATSDAAEELESVFSALAQEPGNALLHIRALFVRAFLHIQRPRIQPSALRRGPCERRFPHQAGHPPQAVRP